MLGEYGDWTDWLLCLGIAVLLGARWPMRNPEGHSPKYWRKHPNAIYLPPSQHAALKEAVPRSPRSPSLWSFIVSWPVVGIVGPSIVLLGFGVLSMSPPETKLAQWCFAVGYLIILAKIVYWVTFERAEPPLQRAVFTALIFAAAGVLWFSSSMFALSKHGMPNLPQSSQSAFAITQSTAWVSPEFSDCIYWISFNGSRNITPIHVMVFYIITNLKSTPVLISRLSLELHGSHDTWWALNRLPTNQPIISADLAHTPQKVNLITLPDGFLADKVANVELAAGASAQGWLLYQLPADYAFPRDINELKLRLTVHDTAGDVGVQPAVRPSTDGSILFTAMHIGEALNVNLIRDYQIITYGEP